MKILKLLSFLSYGDADTVVLEILPSSADVAAYIDANTLVFRLVPSGSDVYTAPYIDTTTVVFRIVPSGSDAQARTDVGSVALRFGVDGHDCYFPLQPSYVFNGSNKWFFPDELQKWNFSGTNKWAFESGWTEPPEC